MNQTQLAAFKAAMLADANVTPLITAGDQFSIAAYYNANTNPVQTVWRPSVTLRELNTAIDWSVFAGLTVGKQNAYFAMTEGGSIDATSANIRNGFSAVFGAGTTLTALTAIAQRTATRFEAIAAFFSSNVSTMYGHIVTLDDVAQALGS